MNENKQIRKDLIYTFSFGHTLFGARFIYFWPSLYDSGHFGTAGFFESQITTVAFVLRFGCTSRIML